MTTTEKRDDVRTDAATDPVTDMKSGAAGLGAAAGPGAAAAPAAAGPGARAAAVRGPGGSAVRGPDAGPCRGSRGTRAVAPADAGCSDDARPGTAADADGAPGGEPGAGAGEAGADGEPGADGGSGGGDGEADAPEASRVRAWWRLVRRQPKRRVAATAVLALLLLAAGGLRWEQGRLADPAAGRNHALTDTASTDQVIGDVSNALGRIFAYTPDDTRTTADAARDVLAGTAAAQYQALFARITQQVAAQHLTLTTRVVRAGVVTLTDGRARLLVFLDQTAQRAGATATTAAAQLSVTAELRGGRWRITSLTAR